MKKAVIIISIAVVLIVTAVLSLIIWRSYIYSDWQTVSVSEVGEFKVPQEWIVTRRENVMYITDKPIDDGDYKIYLIGTIYGEDIDDDVHPEDLFENTEYLEVVRDVNYSNSGGCGLAQYNISGKIEEKYIVKMTNVKNYIKFIAWDNLLDEDTLKKIAKSYSG